MPIPGVNLYKCVRTCQNDNGCILPEWRRTVKVDGSMECRHVERHQPHGRSYHAAGRLVTSSTCLPCWLTLLCSRSLSEGASSEHHQSGGLSTADMVHISMTKWIATQSMESWQLVIITHPIFWFHLTIASLFCRLCYQLGDPRCQIWGGTFLTPRR